MAEEIFYANSLPFSAPMLKDTTEVYEEYLSQITGLDFNFIADRLGVKVSGQDVIIPFFGKPYRVSTKAITDPSGKQPHLSICVILCKYLLMRPMIEPLGGNWMTYKDFRMPPL